MSGKSPPPSKSRIPSRIPRLKKHASSTSAPSFPPSLSHQHSHSHDNSADSLDIPACPAKTVASRLPRPSASSAFVPLMTVPSPSHSTPASSLSRRASPFCLRPSLAANRTRKLQAPDHRANAQLPPAPSFPARLSGNHGLPHSTRSSSSRYDPASPSRLRPSLRSNEGRLGARGLPTTTKIPSTPTSRLASSSGDFALSTSNRLRARASQSPQPYPHHTTESTAQNYSPTQPAYSTPPQHIRGQTLSYQGPSHMFNQAQNFVVRDTTFIENNIGGDNFMERLLQETIIGAEFDSSARDPPPRCHPGTRLAIIQRCLDFINQCNDQEKMREGSQWRHLCFYIPFRQWAQGWKKVIVTIAYQLAVKSGAYRQFIRDEISLDPSLLRKSLSVQFDKFIVEPFMHKSIFEPSCRFLMIVDGLDECDNPLTQRKLLELISSLCIEYPTSPIAWIVASRPEPHITSFFERAEVKPTYKKEEMVIDSDEACEEVQRYLRDELTKIKLDHPTLKYKQEWPLEHDFTKLAASAGGLFAYAATVVRYIGDPTHGGPAAQLRHVLEIIDSISKDRKTGGDHPMERLDALYKRILSNVPDDVMINTRKLLLLGLLYDYSGAGFRMRCNALQLTEEDAYDAICHLHAVMKVPEPNQADNKFSSYHKSFDDFLSDFDRSGISRDIRPEAYGLCDHASLRVLEELRDGSDGVAGGKDIELWGGVMKGHYQDISLSWPGDGRFKITDEEMRIQLCTTAIRWIVVSFPTSESLSMMISCFHALTIHFSITPLDFPFYKLRDCVFDQFRDELTNLGKLDQVPLRTLDYAAVCGNVELRFTSPTRSDLTLSSPWNQSCEHIKNELDGSEQQKGWITSFTRIYEVDPPDGDDTDAHNSSNPRFYIAEVQPSHRVWVQENTRNSHTAACIHCARRLARFFEDSPELPATVFVDSTQMTYVEVSFVDVDDRVSEWRYRFLHSGAPTSINA